MTVHCLQVTVAQVDPSDQPVDAQQKKTQVRNWVDNHEEVLQTQSSDFSAGNTADDGTGTDFYRGRWRFGWAEDPVAMKDAILSFLQNNFKWWAVAYHQCDHDDAQGGCSWDNEWSSSSPAPPADLLVLG